MLPVRPARCTRTSTPAASSSAVRAAPRASSPTRPTKRLAAPVAAAKTATFAALPPRVRSTRPGLSVPCRSGPSVQTTTSSTTSPMQTSTGPSSALSA